MKRRYIWGAGADELVAWYEGIGSAARRFPVQDERASIVAVTDSAGALVGINRYDEYGIPAATNIGRFQYTGQAFLAEAGWRITPPRVGAAGYRLKRLATLRAQ